MDKSETTSAPKKISKWPVRILAFVIVFSVIGAMISAQANAQADARNTLRTRFVARASTTSNFLSTYVKFTLTREQKLATERLGDKEITHDQFLDFLDTFGFGPSVMLDKTGHVLDVAPRKEELIGVQLSEKYDHLKGAVDGKPTVSNVVPSASLHFPIVAFATPFDSASGPRVMSGAYDLTTRPMGQFLHNVLTLKGSAVYLVDANNDLIASDKDHTGALAKQDSHLVKALKKNPTYGEYISDKGVESVFATHAVAGTPWRVVLTEHKAIYAKNISGMHSLLPWIFIAAFGLVFIALMIMLVRALERKKRDRRS